MYRQGLLLVLVSLFILSLARGQGLLLPQLFQIPIPGIDQANPLPDPPNKPQPVAPVQVPVAPIHVPVQPLPDLAPDFEVDHLDALIPDRLPPRAVLPHDVALISGPVFERGDANADGAVDVADALGVLNFLMSDGRRPACEKAGDFNDDGTLDVSDALALLGAKFLGRGPLPAPYGDCGVDATADRLSCRTTVCGPQRLQGEREREALLGTFLDNVYVDAAFEDLLREESLGLTELEQPYKVFHFPQAGRVEGTTVRSWRGILWFSDPTATGVLTNHPIDVRIGALETTIDDWSYESPEGARSNIVHNASGQALGALTDDADGGTTATLDLDGDRFIDLFDRLFPDGSQLLIYSTLGQSFMNTILGGRDPLCFEFAAVAKEAVQAEDGRSVLDPCSLGGLLAGRGWGDPEPSAPPRPGQELMEQLCALRNNPAGSYSWIRMTMTDRSFSNGLLLWSSTIGGLVGVQSALSYVKAVRAGERGAERVESHDRQQVEMIDRITDDDPNNDRDDEEFPEPGDEGQGDALAALCDPQGLRIGGFASAEEMEHRVREDECFNPAANETAAEAEERRLRCTSDGLPPTDLVELLDSLQRPPCEASDPGGPGDVGDLGDECVHGNSFTNGSGSMAQLPGNLAIALSFCNPIICNSAFRAAHGH